jgi:hypothetical protein
MATINFSNIAAGGAINLTLTMVAGSLKLGGGDDVRGGGNIPSAKAGLAKNGSCQVVVKTATETWAAIYALTQFVGEGQFVVTVPNAQTSYNAVVEATLTSDGVQLADISWMGTKEPVEA